MYFDFKAYFPLLCNFNLKNPPYVMLQFPLDENYLKAKTGYALYHNSALKMT